MVPDSDNNWQVIAELEGCVANSLENLADISQIEGIMRLFGGWQKLLFCSFEDI
jgi:hypothetical protein